MHPLAASSADSGQDSLETLRYPIGPPPLSAPNSIEARERALAEIAALPAELLAAFDGLPPAALDTQYREGGWTLRQLAHHVADSHLNAYTRLRFALTEDWPVIKPYSEALWAELPDARRLPVEPSLALLAALHTRWVTLLQSLDESQWERGYMHPQNGPTTVAAMTALYGWHGRHHTAHALALRAQRGW